MNTNNHKKQVCPICHTKYTGYPAISRILDYVDESNYEHLKEYLEDCKWLID